MGARRHAAIDHRGPFAHPFRTYRVLPTVTTAVLELRFVSNYRIRIIVERIMSHSYSLVVCNALRLMEARERRLVTLDAAVERGNADIDAGRMHDADAVFDDLDAELQSLPDRPS